MKRAHNLDSEINPKRGIMEFPLQSEHSRIDDSSTSQPPTYQFSPFTVASVTLPPVASSQGKLPYNFSALLGCGTRPESMQAYSDKPQQMLNSWNLDTYFEIGYSFHYCNTGIYCRRLLIRPIRGDFELPKEILIQYLTERKEYILEKLEIKESGFSNILDIFDLIAIDINIPTDLHQYYTYNTDKWLIAPTSLSTLQPVYIKKEFIRIAEQYCPQIENLMAAYAFFPG